LLAAGDTLCRKSDAIPDDSGEGVSVCWVDGVLCDDGFVDAEPGKGVDWSDG
jgi:hypothetical protein